MSYGFGEGVWSFGSTFVVGGTIGVRGIWVQSGLCASAVQVVLAVLALGWNRWRCMTLSSVFIPVCSFHGQDIKTQLLLTRCPAWVVRGNIGVICQHCSQHYPNQTSCTHLNVLMLSMKKLGRKSVSKSEAMVLTQKKVWCVLQVRGKTLPLVLELKNLRGKCTILWCWRRSSVFRQSSVFTDLNPYPHL